MYLSEVDGVARAVCREGDSGNKELNPFSFFAVQCFQCVEISLPNSDSKLDEPGRRRLALALGNDCPNIEEGLGGGVVP
jgi:hypothetical protein